MDTMQLFYSLLASGKYKLLYSKKEAAELLECSINDIPKLINRGKLNFYRNPLRGVNPQNQKIPLLEIVEHIIQNTKGKRIEED